MLPMSNEACTNIFLLPSRARFNFAVKNGENVANTFNKNAINDSEQSNETRYLRVSNNWVSHADVSEQDFYTLGE